MARGLLSTNFVWPINSYIKGDSTFLYPILKYEEDVAHRLHHHRGHIKGRGVGWGGIIDRAAINPSDKGELNIDHLLQLTPLPVVPTFLCYHHFPNLALYSSSSLPPSGYPLHHHDGSKTRSSNGDADL